MDTILGTLAIALLIISIPCLILGLIQPKVFSRFFKKGVNRKKTSLIFGSAFLVSIVLIIIFSAGTPSLADMKSPTNQKNLTVSGSTSYHNSNIKIYLNGDVAREMKADDKGDFSTTVELKEGSNKIKASATNDNNKTKSCPEVEVVYDITPPDISFDQPKSPTDSNKFTLSGKSEKSAQIIIYSAGKEIKKTKVKNDSFEIKDIALIEGENKFTVKAIDEADNHSQSKNLAVVYNRPKEEAKKSESSSQTPASKLATPTPTPKVEQTIDKLWTALDNTIKTRNGYDVIYNADYKTVRVTREPVTALNETVFVRSAYDDFVQYGQIAFQIEGVEDVEFLYWADMTDSYGKESKEKGIQIAMKKSEFSTYDWKNLGGRSVYNQMNTSCYTHYIHPAILKNVEIDKLILLLV